MSPKTCDVAVLNYLGVYTRARARTSAYAFTRCGIDVMNLSGENLENGNMKVAFVGIVNCPV